MTQNNLQLIVDQNKNTTNQNPSLAIDCLGLVDMYQVCDKYTNKILARLKTFAFGWIKD